nr:ABC transporter permease [Flaviflexus huanghaiensis]
MPPSADHWFGTDESGRDTFRRVVHGTGDSLVIGVAATGIGLAIASLLGIGAALGPRWLDFTLSRFVEVLFALPGIVLALLLITVVGPGVTTSTIAVGLATAPGYARMIRTQTIAIANSGYVEADRALGRTRRQILARRIAPNLVVPLFVIATLGVGQGVVWAASLSYLGLGVAPPSPEWGAMMNAGRTYLTSSAWWMTLFPGVAIILTAVSTTVLSRSIAAASRRA